MKLFQKLRWNNNNNAAVDDQLSTSPSTQQQQQQQQQQQKNKKQTSSTNNRSTPTSNKQKSSSSSVTSPTTSNSLKKHHHHHHHHHHKKGTTVPQFKMVSVQNSDSLLSIAKKFNMSEEDLVIVNRLASTRYLIPGQVIVTCLNFNTNTIIRPISYSLLKDSLSHISLASSTSSTSTTLSTSVGSLISLADSNNAVATTPNSKVIVGGIGTPGELEHSNSFHDLHLAHQPPVVSISTAQSDNNNNAHNYNIECARQREQIKQMFDMFKQSHDSLVALAGGDSATATMEQISSHKLFLPSLRERGNKYLTTRHEEDYRHHHEYSAHAPSADTQLLPDCILSFKNAIYYLDYDTMQMQLHGSIQINAKHLAFAARSSNYSFNRIEVALTDVLFWKFDEVSTDLAEMNDSISSDDHCIFKIWVKLSEEEEDDEDDDDDSTATQTEYDTVTSATTDTKDEEEEDEEELEDGGAGAGEVEEKIFIIDKTEIDMELWESILIEILGQPLNHYYRPDSNSNKTTSPKDSLSFSSDLLAPLTPASPRGGIKQSTSARESFESEHPLLTKTSLLLDHQQLLPDTTASKINTIRNIKKNKKQEAVFKREIHCIFQSRKVKGTLTLLPHWIIFQGNPDDKHVIQEGSIRFQLNYTMDQVVSCTLETKTAPLSASAAHPLSSSTSLSEDEGELQFQIEDHVISDREGSRDSTSNSEFSRDDPSTISHVVSKSLVHVTLMVTPTIEKKIHFECEDEVAVNICQQINQWMGEAKNNVEVSPTGNTGTMILDNILPLSPLKSGSPSTFAKMLFRWNKGDDESEEEDEEDDDDVGPFVPTLFGNSAYIDPEDTLHIISDLPRQLQLRDWVLLYQTGRDGISMNTFFNKTESQGACIIFMRDFNHNIFGGFLSESIRRSNTFYGSGECFLFKLKPAYQPYHWSRENRCFILTSNNFISMGAGNNGKYGLWLDDNFDEGTSGKSETFNNDPLSTLEEDFKCLDMEIWGFV
ncbi:hypothetical protein SAMD00019534_064690 [Acytostelium subglobosum LB1]|uniref:hypothetical protein n=1 Tax=Acytostelium subglobosum LB1 TaxID=1410327 RepID=UPI0006451789|nr:hypothetical protein SAMD00019534_064690 [Acytostelium subglobosum LB1]GAM23294.1 hypothetical protein SAMD00019534_064690 [Acytostelium subglobosum LB1]|eukprot:XP_012753743.1 hypothetical protein SAMD00019534_064690 [Acytostelium subglobosum LB1]